jgi:hypothetical protein
LAEKRKEIGLGRKGFEQFEKNSST